MSRFFMVQCVYCCEILNDRCNLSQTLVSWSIVKYSKLCESMTILASVHLRGIQINGGILV